MDTTTFERKAFFTKLIWLFPIIYLLHIIEESNGFTEWVTHTLGGEITLKRFLINNSAFMLVNIGCCYLAMRIQKPWTTFVLFFWVTAQEFWNFFFHIYTTVQFKAYSPGYYTAIFLYLPVYFYLTYLLLRDKHLNWKLWLLAFVTSPSAMAFTIWSALYHFGEIPFNEWF